MGTQEFLQKGRKGRKRYAEGRIHSPSVGFSAERNRCVQMVEPRMDTDEHGWVRGIFSEGKEGKEGVTRRGGIGGAAFLPHRLGPGAERNRCGFFEPRMDTG